MANNKGNPNLYKSGFKTDKKEACTANLSMRMPPSLLNKLREKENYQDFVRETLKKALEAESA